MTHEDFFDDALHVETRFHEQGYNDGLRDGAQSGLAEGRAFGLQRGFEKFLESGRLAGKAIVWANRLPKNSDGGDATTAEAGRLSLAPLPSNARLEKNINTLYTLVDPKTVSTDNSDAAVQDFDERLKKAQGKERIIDRVVSGPSNPGSKSSGAGPSV